MTGVFIQDQKWSGNHLSVEVLYSKPGVAQQIIVENKHGYLLIDTGDGVIRDLLGRQLDRSYLRGILFTHGHFDHMGGLHSLLGFLRMIGRKEPLPVVGPAGCREVFSILDNFQNCYGNTIPFEIQQKKVNRYDEININGMSIQIYPVVHCGSINGLGVLEQIPAVGYKITFGSETIAITGDTGTNADLKTLVSGVDLAIIEAALCNNEVIDKGLLEKVHLTTEVASELGKLAKNFLLVHRAEK